jgi:hypothetical protein
MMTDSAPWPSGTATGDREATLGDYDGVDWIISIILGSYEARLPDIARGPFGYVIGKVLKFHE